MISLILLDTILTRRHLISDVYDSWCVVEELVGLLLRVFLTILFSLRASISNPSPESNPARTYLASHFASHGHHNGTKAGNPLHWTAENTITFCDLLIQLLHALLVFTI
ncbi:uncharacterized protein H6S33_011456 [Morchella sextelata]|uniref:uncharacterized protein n=1 Tax=Morchella sextelata TaxID=1174677 RepID=UPI001D0378ED|nr:uncharacterized protein H6S33_011456 [Morchella sextelata]KAH0611029.1 hypothetical protein H6S33_011456 [Morchella sextelata]